MAARLIGSPSLYLLGTGQQQINFHFYDEELVSERVYDHVFEAGAPPAGQHFPWNIVVEPD